MNQSNLLGRLLALRLLEEEREEARLRANRALQQTCIESLRSFEQQTRLVSQTLHEALVDSEHTVAIAAAMELAFAPLRGAVLKKQAARLATTVEVAEAVWQTARTHRLQIESVVVSMKERQRKEVLAREQKTMDGWFLMRKNAHRPSPPSAMDESFPRECCPLLGDDGMPLAQQSCE